MFSGGALSEYPISTAFESAGTFMLGTATFVLSREFRIFAGTTEFVTKDTDELSSRPFLGTLLQPLSFTRSLLGSDIIGNFSSGTGELKLSNIDGEYDTLIQGYAIDGRPIVVKAGREGDDYDDFYTIFDGTASDWVVKEDAVIIKLVDNGYLLDVTIQPTLYAGTGSIEGTADLKGKRKPRAFGYVKNISPPLVIPSSLLYQVNDGSVSAITAVYDRGVALSFGADYATNALLTAASVSAGNYSTCIAEGMFRVGSTPSGTITADVSGDNRDSSFVTTSADIVRRILQSSSIADPDGLYLPSFTQVNTLQPADIGYYVGPDDTNTIADAIANIMGGIGGWGGFRRNGKFALGVFLTPVGGITSHRFDRSDVFSIGREALPSALTPPPYRFRCAYQHNWTVQNDVAASVGATRASFLAQADRYSDSIDNGIRVDHPFAHDRDPIASYFNLEADAQTESDRLLALYSIGAGLYRFTVGVEPFAFDVGDIVTLTYPRWDLSSGRDLRVVEMTEDAANNTIELVAYG